MAKYNFNRHFPCPWCKKGEALADGKGKVTISLVCPKCERVYLVDLDTGKTERSTACRRTGRR